MKIVDNKGRLFGIINIIDLLVLLAIVALVVIGVSRMGKGIVTTSSTKEGIVTYEISDIRQVTIDNIKIGDPVYHYDKGTYIGEIVDVKIEPFKEKVDHNGRWIEAEVPRRFVALVDVKTNLEETDQYYVVGGEQTRVGIQFRLKNKNFASFGIVMGIEVAE